MKSVRDKSVARMPEFEGIPYEVVRRRVKYPRVEFKNGHLRVIVPRSISPGRILEDNRASILRKYNRLMEQIDAASRLQAVNWGEDQFHAIISRSLEHYSRQLRVEPKQIKFRKMKRRWGSCRSDGVITFNVFLQFVPEHLIAYIVYHELTHLIIRGHSRRFKAIIYAEFPNHRQLDSQLNLYGLKLLS